MQYERADLEKAYIKLVQQEKPTFALLAAVIGLIPAALFLLLVGQYFILSLVIACSVFPAIPGLFARYVGRLYSPASRIPVMLVVGCVYIAIGILFKAPMLWFLFVPISFAVAFVASKKTLTTLELLAIDEHSIRPFQAKETSDFRKTTQPLAVLFSLPVLAYLYFLLPHNSCLKNIEANNYSSINEKCTLSTFVLLSNWLKGDDPVLDHQFGTYYSPTAEAILIRSKAESGDTQFQILWWSIVDELYRAGPLSEHFAGTDKYENEARLWRHKAALFGHFPAVKRELEIYYSLSTQVRAEDVKQQAIAFSKQLALSKIEGAGELAKAANNIVSHRDIVKFYQTQLGDLTSLSFDELDNLAYATEKGEFHYYMNDFNKDVPNTGYYTDSINVEVNQDKALEILKLMSLKFQNADASYKVFQKLARSNSELAVSFLEQAATQGHATGAALLGKIRYCQNRKTEGVTLLNKAAELGSDIADKQRKEIARTQSLSACGN